MRVLGPVVALGLVGLGLLVLVAAVGALLGADHELPWRGVSPGAWASPTTRLVSAVLAAAGMLLVGLTLRGSRAEVGLRTDDPAVAGTTSRRAVARLVAASVRSADGMSATVDVVVARSTVRVRVTRTALAANRPGSITVHAHAAATAALGTLALERPLAVAVTERSPRSAARARSTG